MRGKGFQPQWAKKAPEANSFRSIFKWGAPDQFKHPNPRLYAMIKETFGMTDADFEIKIRPGNERVPPTLPSRLPSGSAAAFAKMVGPENVQADAYSRVKYASGKTMEEAIALRENDPGEVADLVLHPRTKADVAKIVAHCHETRIPLYVYGGGSSVTLGVRPVAGGVTLVMATHMNRMTAFSEKNQTITVEGGMTGPDLETLLNQAPARLSAKRAYTCGHFPQSFEFSTVGGWIAALGSGQESSYYGDMCDMVISQEYITPTGSFRTLDYPATATGPKVGDIMIGSEGAFGVMVAATLKIFRHMPENLRRFGFIFPSWQKAVDAAREISQGQFGTPSVLRISDPEETDVALKLYGVEGTPLDWFMGLRDFTPGQRCLLIGQSTGEAGFTRNVKSCVKRICHKFGAMYLTGFPAAKWSHGRFRDPYMREDLGDFGIVIDTLETGITWENLHRVHREVRAFIKDRPETICMTHASHFYPQGTNLYFIFIARFSNLSEYKRFQNGIIEKIHDAGGSLSHHHGVGKMIAPWMERHMGKEQMAVLRTLKHHFDPHCIMNPGGTLGLDV